MLKLFLKEVAKECTGIVSRKKPSLLRKTSAADMKELSFQKACFELKERSPLFYSVLMTAAIPSGGRKGNAEVEKWLSSVAVAGSVLLKQRCQNMNAVQLMITTLIKYTGFHVSGYRLLSTNLMANCNFTLTTFPIWKWATTQMQL